jgi:hypothetical protein
MPYKKVYVEKKKAGTKEHWSPRQKREAVAAYLILGNMMFVVASTGIPEDTLRGWKAQQWWKDTEEEIRKGSKLELSGKLSKVISKTVEQLDDRVTNGDFIYEPKTKSFHRKPVDARTASRITVDLIDRAILLDDKVSTDRITDEGLEMRLKKLKEEMIKFSLRGKPRRTTTILEGIYSHVVQPNEQQQQQQVVTIPICPAPLTM